LKAYRTYPQQSWISDQVEHYRSSVALPPVVNHVVLGSQSSIALDKNQSQGDSAASRLSSQAVILVWFQSNRACVYVRGLTGVIREWVERHREERAGFWEGLSRQFVQVTLDSTPKPSNIGI
jgi:hypothetical protein